MKLKKNIYLIALLAGVALMSAQGAYADVTVVYKMALPNGSGTQTIRYADKQHVRVDMLDATNHKTSILKRGGKVYAITGKVVQDMSQLSGMMASLGRGQKNRRNAQAPIRFKDTGRIETIAGIRGKVYRFIEKGKAHEVVLGRNNDLQDAVLGVIEITKAVTGMMPFNPADRIQQDASIKSMALLRLDDRVRLQSMNTRSVPASTFNLPSKPQQMGGVGGLMKGLFGK